MSTPSTSLPPNPPTISNFQFIKPISSGAFGQVYLARKPPTNTIYAIKVLLKKDLVRKNMTSQVVQERTALLSTKSNDFCVKLFYSLQSHEHVYFVMEYCSGGDLKSLLNHMRFFSIPMAGFYVAEVATALNYIHSRGIIHRDIKPDNMLVDSRGHVKLIDFGLSDVGVKNKLVGSPLVGYTPGMVASLGQNLTFSYTSPNSSTSPADFQSCSGNLSSMSSPGVNELQGSQPNHHSTPVGSLGTAGNPNHQNPVVMHTKHRKVRIPLRKLGSRSHLNTSSNSSDNSLSCSDSSSSSSSSSWCVINTPSQQEISEPEPDPPLNVKRVKLTSSSHNQPFNFDDSSFLSFSFNFAKKAEEQNNVPQITPPTTLPTRLPLNTSSPIPLVIEDATTPTSGFSAFSSNMFTPPNLTMSPVATQNNPPQSHDHENFFTEQSSEHDRPSPERGRFRNERSTSGFFSMPLLHPNNNNEKTSNVLNSPELSHQSKFGVLQESSVNRPNNVYFNPNPKSPTWPLPKLPTPMVNEAEKPKKRKRHTEGPVSFPPHHHSTGLTADVSAMLIGAQQHTPATEASHSLLCKTPQNGVRLLGTPDYLAPELIRLAMNENDSRTEQDCVGVTVACDWWSLGVCFYEFVIGVLPFNDDTPDLIFNNILDRELEYPEGMDERLVRVLDGLICSDPNKRFRFDELRDPEYLVLFGLGDVGDWGRLRDMEVPWVPGGGE